MNIMDLDEAEGLTAEMVCQYLSASPVWRPRSSGAMFCDKHAGRSRLVWPSAVARDLGGTLCDIAHAEHRSPQAILREMNPRMRKGKPSDDEIGAHVQRGGIWIASRGELGNGGTICFINFYWDTGMEDPGPFSIWDGLERSDTLWEDGYDLAEWSFWPCDAHGNKVRWPAVSDAT